MTTVHNDPIISKTDIALPEFSGGVYGESSVFNGVRGVTFAPGHGAVVGIGDNRTAQAGPGVFGESVMGDGVRGVSHAARKSGVVGTNDEGLEVGRSGGIGVFGHSDRGVGVWGSVIHDGGNAGYFHGSVTVNGIFSKAAGSFRIDHPLDPANKYLSHSFVESPDMMNIYNGNIVLDAEGRATIELPAYFGALNNDFRYQLTAIGAPAPNLHVAEEIADNRFVIAGGSAGQKVSWQVTGIRQDAYAIAHRIPVEEDKPACERGTYLTPKLFGQPESKGVDFALTSRLRSGS